MAQAMIRGCWWKSPDGMMLVPERRMVANSTGRGAGGN